MRSLAPAILLLLLLFEARCQAPFRLRTDKLLNTHQVYERGFVVDIPLDSALKQQKRYQFAFISNPNPVLSWETPRQGGGVTACQILAATDARLLQSNRADLWDSQKISSRKNQTVYQGKPLKPGTIIYWKVRTWNQKGVASAYSATAAFYLSEPDPAEPFAHQPLVAEMQQPRQIIKTTANSYFFDFGKDALAQISLHLTSPVTDSIWIEVGEALEKPGVIHKNPGRNIRYHQQRIWVKAGTHSYVINWLPNEKRNSRNPVQMPAYIGEVYPFRYLSLHNFQGSLNPQSVQRKIVFYPFDETASSFSSADTVLNQIWDLCKYSMKATSFTGYYVDGDRERVPYEADALINQLSHYAVDAEYSIGRRSMNYLIYHPTWPTEWSLQNVLIAWNDYQYTGDNLLLRKYYTELQHKILMPLAGPDGLISTRTNKQTDDFLKTIHITATFDNRRGLHDNVDWPQTGDYIGNEKEYKGETDGFVYNTYNAVINAYYYRNLVLMSQIAAILGKTADAQLYATKAAAVSGAFLKTFQDTRTGLIKDGDSTSHTSLHANMFALAFGLVPPKDKAKVVQFIKTRKMACSVYGAQFLMDALYEAGEPDYALQLLTSTAQRSWYNMIRVGSTITLEAWDKVYKPNLDWNHAWGAAPGNIIVRKLMGVEPLEPGFTTFSIKPQPGSLAWASLKTPTIKGPVQVSFNRTATVFTMKAEVPGGTRAMIYIPADTTKKQLTINGQASRIKPGNGYYLIPNAGPGHYTFELK